MKISLHTPFTPKLKHVWKVFSWTQFFLKVLTVFLFELKYMKWIIVWTADEDMKVNMIFTVEWTTWAVEKEPEKIQAWRGIEP